MRNFDVLVYIGRFAPFTDAHGENIREALKQAKKVAVIIGSANKARDTRDPFTAKERAQMITAAFPQEVAEGRIQFVYQNDYPYMSNMWLQTIQSAVSTIANTPFTPDPVKIGLIGHSKDSSSFYLKMFPTWESVNTPNFKGINATDAREAFFSAEGAILSTILPAGVCEWLKQWRVDNEVTYEIIRKELADEKRKKERYAELHYDPVFQTVDSVVTQSGHVLLTKRRAFPGKGLMALPGGFLKVKEGMTCRESAISILKDKTNIKLNERTLDRCIRSVRQFDDPYRSRRGRTITTAYHIELQDDVELVKVSSGRNTEYSQWVPFAELDPTQMFEDHYHIIQAMIQNTAI